MFWLFAWLLLLLLFPDSASHFVNDRIHFFDIPYVGVALILFPVSFFISYFLKRLWSSLIGMCRNIKGALKFRRAKKEIQSLTEKEKEIIKCLFDGDDIGDFANDEDGIYIHSLISKSIIHEHHDIFITKYELDCYYRKAFIILLVEAHNMK